MKKQVVSGHSAILAEWEEFFWKIHKAKVDFAGVNIPEANDDEYPWFSCIPGDFSTQRVYDGGEEQYLRWKFSDKLLDDVLDLSFGRDGWKHPYIVRFRMSWESDKDLRDLSANTIMRMGINTGTLKERLLLGDFLYWKYKKHLDTRSWTFCTGSRFSDGTVPHVDWSSDDRKMRVYYYLPNDRNSALRARRVVVVS